MLSASNGLQLYHPQQVRDACQRVAQTARHVRINDQAIADWAPHFDLASLPLQHAPQLRPELSDAESLARFALLCNSLNFSFFPDDPAEPWRVEWKGRQWTRYEAFAASWCRAIDAHRSWLDPVRWASATLGELHAVFAGQGMIPLLPERLAVLRGIGDALLRTSWGQVCALIDHAESRAGRIVSALCQKVGSFVDVAMYDGQPVPILKRAQLFVADLAEAWKTCGRVVSELESLTAFADYRLPAALRGLGILQLDEALGGRIDRQEWLAPGESAEVELRACTVTAVERMVAAAGATYPDLQAWRLDWWLWRYARKHSDALPAHHRVRSIYY